MTSDVPQELNYVLRGVNRLYKRAGNAFSPKIPHSVVGGKRAEQLRPLLYQAETVAARPRDCASLIT